MPFPMHTAETYQNREWNNICFLWVHKWEPVDFCTSKRLPLKLTVHPYFISIVAIARILSTSTIVFKMISVIATPKPQYFFLGIQKSSPHAQRCPLSKETPRKTHWQTWRMMPTKITIA
jgi:hypothetical protein